MTWMHEFQQIELATVGTRAKQSHLVSFIISPKDPFCPAGLQQQLGCRWFKLTSWFYFLIETNFLILKGNFEQLLSDYIIKWQWMDMLTWWMRWMSALKTEWRSYSSFPSSTLAPLQPYAGQLLNLNYFIFKAKLKASNQFMPFTI